ncbi:MAG: response regulator/pilus assembly protein [Anaerolineae bacterium]
MSYILIVDDDQDIQRLMSFALSRAGYQVRVANDGEEGLQKALQAHPALIIADIMMPKMTGYQFCREIRAVPALEKTPILIYSARFQPVDQKAALEAGATDYIPKSVTPDQIVTKINNLLSHPARDAGLEAGRLLGILSLRGGVGVTTLAVNLAVALAFSRKEEVGLLDLAPVAGHAPLLLGLRPGTSYLDAFEKNEISPQTVRPYLTAHDSGVRLLASPLAFPGNDVPPADGFFEIGQALRTAFALTILDFPHTFSIASDGLLSNATKVILVLGPDIGSIQSAAIALQHLGALGLEPNRINLVLNHPTPASGLGPEMIQKALNRPVNTVIPYEAEMLAALNSRTPLMLYAPKSPAAIAIARLGAMLTS